MADVKKRGFSARPSNTSSFRNRVIAPRGKMFGKINSSHGKVTSDLDIIYFLLNPLSESSKGAQDLVSSRPSSREVSVMEIVPGSE